MKLRKELWFGFTLMAIIVGMVVVFTPWGSLNNGHLGLIMLAMIVVSVNFVVDVLYVYLNPQIRLR